MKFMQGAILDLGPIGRPFTELDYAGAVAGASRGDSVASREIVAASSAIWDKIASGDGWGQERLHSVSCQDGQLCESLGDLRRRHTWEEQREGWSQRCRPAIGNW